MAQNDPAETADPPRSTLSTAARWGRRLLGLALAFLLLLGTAWLAVPPLLKWQIETQGSTRLGRALSVGKVEFEPWALRLTLRDLRLAAAAGDADRSPQLQLGTLLVDADLRSIWRRAPVLEALEADGLRLRLARLSEGHYDIDDLIARLPRPASQTPSAEPARFALFNLQLRDAALHFDDRPMQRVHELSALTLTLPFLSNLPDDLAVKVLPRLAFRLDGAAFVLQGESLPFAADRASVVRLNLVDADLAPWWPYVPAAVPLRPASGQGGHLSADLALSFAQPAAAAPRVGLSGTLGLRDIGLQDRAVQDASAAPLLGWRKLSVGLADVRPLERHVALKSIQLDGAVLDLRRGADGSLNLARLGGATPSAKPPAAAPSASAPAASSTSSAAAPGGWQLALDELAVADARIRWRDASVTPAADLDLAELRVQAQTLRWPMAVAAPFEAGLQLRAGGHDLGRLDARGNVSAQAAQVALQLDAFDLAAVGPYLRPLLRPTLDGQLTSSAELDWASGDTPRLALTLSTLRANALRLTEPGTTRQRERPLQVAAIELDDARIDIAAHRLQIGALRIRQPALDLRRDAAGTWNAAQWAAPAVPAPAAAKSASVKPQGKAAPAAAPWTLDLRDARLDGGALRFSDAAARPGSDAAPVTLQLKALRLAAQGLHWPAAPGAAPPHTQFSAQIVEPVEVGAVDSKAATAPVGRLDWRGDVWPQPVGARGKLVIDRFPAHLFEPYFGSALPVWLRRAEVGYGGDIELRQTAQGLKLSSGGDLLLADVQVHARNSEGRPEDGDDLLSWQALSLRPLKVLLAPGAKPQIEIGEVQLTDFFARLQVTEQGRFNLRDVGASSAQAPAPAASGPVAAVAGVAASAASGAASPSGAASATAGGLPVDLTVGGIKLVNGRVDFSDRFIKPSYRADLSELNGRIGRISSATPRDLAQIELRGRAARTALLEIGGAFNPTANPLALDITAKVSDLELAPLSPYAGKYAGYAIERGKLSVDVAYRIDADGKLQARNQLTLNQLTFGEAIESPSATKLPVRLAVSLLTDRNGVIDINLPIAGSVNDPQFSVWGIVFQVIGNLLTKALTAPFSMFAGGETADLSAVPFLPGTVVLAPEAGATLDQVAKALTERPALHMTVTGASDAAAERADIQRADLEARLQAERRRELLRGGASLAAPVSPNAASAAASTDASPIGGVERDKLVREVYRATQLPDKPRNLIGLAKDIPVPEMEALLMAAVPVTDDTARQLALQRGLAVRDALIDRGLPSERLFLAAPKLRSASDDGPWTPRVQLSLATK